MILKMTVAQRAINFCLGFRLQPAADIDLDTATSHGSLPLSIWMRQ